MVTDGFSTGAAEHLNLFQVLTRLRCLPALIVTSTFLIACLTSCTPPKPVSTEKKAPLSWVRPIPQVCETDERGNCQIQVIWQSQSADSCVFAQTEPRTALGCGKSGRARVTINAKTENRLTLRTDNNPDMSILAESTVVGIHTTQSQTMNARTPAEKTGQKENLRPVQLHRANINVLTSTWDGRLYFMLMTSPVSGKRFWSIQTLQPEYLRGRSRSEVNFHALFSGNFYLDGDDFDATEAAELKKIFPRLGGAENLGKNIAQVEDRMHLAVFPDARFANNPYRSDKEGRPNAEGAFRTYKMQLVFAARKADGIQIPFRNDTRNFLLGTRATVTVDVRNKRLPKVVAAEVTEKATILRDKNGKMLIGYEPTVSLDGRLLIYQSSLNEKHLDGFLLYSWRDSSADNQSWSPPDYVSSMYWKEGPGNSAGETKVAGKKFSTRFPIAAMPIRDDKGQVFQAGEPFVGAYPWISLDAADLIASVVASPMATKRRGTVIFGARTRGKIQYVDGPVNPFRGNVTANYLRTESDAEFQELDKKYNELPLRNHAGQTVGYRGAWNILMSPLAHFGTSWSPFADMNGVPLPLHPARESYGLMVSGGSRYVEIPIVDDLDKMLVYFPLNESLQYDRKLIRQAAADPHPHGVHRYSGKLVKIDPSTVPDWSSHHQTGRLEGAQFPFERFQAIHKWQKKRIIADQSHGAVGNSVSFGRSALIRAEISKTAVKKMTDTGAFTLAFWLQAKPGTNAALTRLADIYSVRLKAGKLLIRLGQNKALQVPVKTNSDEWRHLSITVAGQQARVFIDSELQATARLTQKVFSRPGQQTAAATAPVKALPLLLGAKENRNKSIFWLDEYVLMAGVAPQKTINRLAWRRETPQMNRKLAGQSQHEIELGAHLFHSKKLSRDGKISCASCHNARFAFADDQALSVGVDGASGTRNAPSLLALQNTAGFFWDGSAPSLISQVLHPLLNKNEMGLSRSQILEIIAKDSTAKQLFQQAYEKAPDLPLTARALASFVRSLDQPERKFDAEKLAGKARKGWEIFRGRANCIACHSPPHFSDDRYHNIGLAEQDPPDQGRFAVTGIESDRFRFKVPSLVAVAKSAPYFHDGRAGTLAEVIEFYNRGGDSNGGQKSLHIRPLDLSDDDQKALLTFLKTL